VILPGFDYADDYDRTFAEATQPTRIEVTEQGMIIEGIVDHSTGADIKGNAINRGIRNVSTLVGWLKLMGTVEAVNLANEITERAKNAGTTDVRLQELFTQEELASIDADLTSMLAEIEAAQ